MDVPANPSLAELIFHERVFFSFGEKKSLLGFSVLQTVLLNLRVIQNFLKEKNVHTLPHCPELM